MGTLIFIGILILVALIVLGIKGRVVRNLAKDLEEAKKDNYGVKSVESDLKFAKVAFPTVAGIFILAVRLRYESHARIQIVVWFYLRLDRSNSLVGANDDQPVHRHARTCSTSIS